MEHIPIAQLADAQVTFGDPVENERRYERIRALHRTGVPVPPISATRHADGTISVIDGRHRITVARELGHATVPVVFDVGMPGEFVPSRAYPGLPPEEEERLAFQHAARRDQARRRHKVMTTKKSIDPSVTLADATCSAAIAAVRAAASVVATVARDRRDSVKTKHLQKARGRTVGLVADLLEAVLAASLADDTIVPKIEALIGECRPAGRRNAR